ncbi:hypothetical protein F5Y12DRAFT_759655 [Xylaria sp. FL1777]|nr:hypothetical protein F5Y12DRAFT_759655 [Xylaria sp. FL1777]
MHIKALVPVVACLAGFLGAVAAVLATSGDLVDIIHHHHHRAADYSHVLPMKHEVQQQARNVLPPPTGPVHRCHDPYPEIFGPAPPVEDCNKVIQQFSALTADITVNLVEGCYQIVSGNCTGLVCPQRPGKSTIPGATAAQYMSSPVLNECIAKGQRGWWNDGQGWGVGVYLA